MPSVSERKVTLTVHATTSTERGQSPNASMLSLAALGLLLLGIWLIWMASGDLLSHLSLTRTEWDRHPATLHHIESVEAKGGMWAGSDGRRWIATVAYTYTTSDNEYSGSNLYIGPEHLWSRLGSRERGRVVAEVRARRPFYVWIDKSDPSRSVVTNEDLGILAGRTYVLAILGGLMIAVSAMQFTRLVIPTSPNES